MAIALLKAGRYPELVGNDIGKNLIKIMEKMGKPDVPKAQAMFGLDSWREDKLKKARDEDAKAKIEDQYSCLKIFLDMGRTLGDAVTYAKHLLTVGGPVKLMTGHKAKGLEWDNVFILDVHLVRMDYTQDRNLKYVMQTRSKDTLYYVRSEDFDLGVRLPDQADEGSPRVEGELRDAPARPDDGPGALYGDIQL
jgi:superfamily I DNA/RNA helicase